MKRRILIALSLAVSLFLLAGCFQAIGGTHKVSVRSEKSNSTAETKTTTNELVVEPLMIVNILSIRSVRLEAGSLTLTVIGPDGDTVWEKTFTAPATFQREVKLDVLTG